MGSPPLLLALLALLLPRGRAWDSGDLELFDLVEEVPRNFYDFLGVQQVSAAPRPAALLERDPAAAGAPCGPNVAGSPPPPPAPDSRAAAGAVTARRCPAPASPPPAVPAPPVAPPPFVPAGRPARGLPAPRTAAPRLSPLCTAAAPLSGTAHRHGLQPPLCFTRAVRSAAALSRGGGSFLQLVSMLKWPRWERLFRHSCPRFPSFAAP